MNAKRSSTLSVDTKLDKEQVRVEPNGNVKEPKNELRIKFYSCTHFGVNDTRTRLGGEATVTFSKRKCTPNCDTVVDATGDRKTRRDEADKIEREFYGIIDKLHTSLRDFTVLKDIRNSPLRREEILAATGSVLAADVLTANGQTLYLDKVSGHSIIAALLEEAPRAYEPAHLERIVLASRHQFHTAREHARILREAVQIMIEREGRLRNAFCKVSDYHEAYEPNFGKKQLEVLRKTPIGRHTLREPVSETTIGEAEKLFRHLKHYK